ncbi:MAG TPA: hypothetical protein PKY05_11065 [Fibrobacteria bacterium]|nr:hypothetical protein [Fibrobacteria bacterium]
MSRRLPFYIVLDTTEALEGEAIEAINCGISTLVQALQSDPYALETMWISVIVIQDDVKRLAALTELSAFKAPRLEARGKIPAHLDGVIHLLVNCIHADVVPDTTFKKGDWRPVILFMLFGDFTAPSDKAMKSLLELRPATIIPCGNGPALEALEAIARLFQVAALDMSATNAHSFVSQIRWQSFGIS